MSDSSMNEATVIMCGPSPDSQGGISSVICTYQSSGGMQALAVSFVPTYTDGSAWQKILVYWRALARITVRIASGNAQLVHLHTASHTSFVRKSSIAVLCWVFRVPYILHIHSGQFVEYVSRESGPIQRAWAGFVLRRAARVIVLTEGYRRLFLEKLCLPCPIVVLPNPTPVALSALARTAANALGIRILFLGAMTRSKGFFDLLEAVSGLQAQGVAATLRCGGSGDMDAIASECRRLRIDQSSEFLGWVDAARRLEELLACDVLVLPSYSEGQPMVIVEAMTAGTAIVASRVGGIPDTVTDGEEAILVEPGEVGALIAALRRLSEEPELRSALGVRGRLRARKYHDPDVVTEKLRAIYAGVLSGEREKV